MSRAPWPTSHSTSSATTLLDPLPPQSSFVDEHILPPDAALSISSQNTTDYLRQAVHSFQEDTRQLFYTSNSLKEVRRLYRYSPFKLEDRAELLARRPEYDLDILWDLDQIGKNALHHDGDSIRLHKAKRIVWDINGEPLHLPLWDRQWTASLFENSQTADQIAHELVLKTHSFLKPIPFTEFLRWVSGCPSDSITHLLSFVSDVQHEFRDRLSTGAECLIREIDAV